jgi:hypothetical protein
MNRFISIVRIINASLIAFFSFEFTDQVRSYSNFFGAMEMQALRNLILTIGFVFILEIFINIIKLITKE